MIMTCIVNYTIFSKVNAVDTLFQYLEKNKLATAAFVLSEKKCSIIQIAAVSEQQD